jgi:hypothetical protein
MYSQTKSILIRVYMIAFELLQPVREAVNRLPYGRFSLLTIDLAQYANMTGPQARGFGKQFFDSVKKGFLDTPSFRIIPVEGSKNPQMYQSVPICLHPKIEFFS